MTEQQSALEQVEQSNEPQYIFPDDAIKIIETEEHHEKMQSVEAILQGTVQGTLMLHPDLTMVTFLVLCSDPDVMNRVFEFKQIQWNQVQEPFLTQKQQILEEIEQATGAVQHKQQNDMEQDPYELQLYVAKPYVEQAFTS